MMIMKFDGDGEGSDDDDGDDFDEFIDNGNDKDNIDNC